MLNILLSSVAVYSVFASSKGRFPMIKKENVEIEVDDSTAVARGRSRSRDEISGRYQYYNDQSRSPTENLHFKEMAPKSPSKLLGVWKRMLPKTPQRYLLVFAHQSGSTSIPQRLMITSSSDTKYDSTRPRSGPTSGAPPPEFKILEQSPKPPASINHGISARESIQTPTHPYLDDARSLDFVSTVQSDHDKSAQGSETESKSLGRGLDVQSEVSCNLREDLPKCQDLVHQTKKLLDELKNPNTEQVGSSSKKQVERNQFHDQMINSQGAIITEMHGKTDEHALLLAEETENRLQNVIESKDMLCDSLYCKLYLEKQEAIIQREALLLEQEKLETANSKIESLEKSQSKMQTEKQRENQKLNQMIEVQEDEINEIRKNLASAEQDKVKLKEEIEGKTTEIGEMTEKINELQQRQSAFEEDRHRMDDATKEWVNQLAAANQENQRLKDLINGLESTLSHIQSEQHKLLDSQREQQEEIATCLADRDCATAALDESKKECDLLRGSVQDAHERNSVLETERNNVEDERWRSQMIWCCVSVTVGTLLMVSILIFCIYHRRRLQAEKMEIYRLRRVNSINKKSQNDDVIIDTFRETNILDNDQEEDKEPESPKREEKKVSSANLKYGESLNDLVRNLDEVQGVLMEDIMDEMVTAGAEDSENVEEQLREDSAGDDHAATVEVSEDFENTPMSLVVEQL